MYEISRPQNFPGPDALTKGFSFLDLRPGMLWQDAVEMRRLIYEKVGLGRGQNVLLMAEDNKACGFSADIQNALAGQGDFQDIDFRAKVKSIPGGTWNIYEDLCSPYKDEYFDVIITCSWHHIDNLDKEAPALLRVLKKGGKLAMTDHGPGPRFYTLMKMDAHLLMLARFMLYFWGHKRGKNLEDGLDVVKKHNVKFVSADIEQAFTPYLIDMGRVEWNGLDMVYGTKSL